MYERSFNPFANNLKIVKDYFKTKTVLVLAITNAVAIALTFMTSIYMTLNLRAVTTDIYLFISQFLGALQSELGLPSDFASSVMEQSSASVSIRYSLPVGAILVCVAYFIIYVKSKNDDPDSSPRAGVLILYILSILELVAVIIAFVTIALTILGFTLYAIMGDDSLSHRVISINTGETLFKLEDLDSTVLIVCGIVLAAILLVAIIIGLIVAVSKKNYYKSVKNSISSVELQNKGAHTYGVMCVLSAVCTGITFFSTLSLFGSSGFNGLRIPGSLVVLIILSALSQLIAFINSVAEAKLALGYNKYINEIKYGYSRPVAPAAPYAPFPSVSGYDPAGQNSYNANVGTDNPYSDPYGSQPAAAAPVCPNCGAPVDPNAPFCGNCGAKL